MQVFSKLEEIEQEIENVAVFNLNKVQTKTAKCQNKIKTKNDSYINI